MSQKSYNHRPEVNESKDRRANAHARKQKLARAKDQDWKRETSMLHLLGYGKYAE